MPSKYDDLPMLSRLLDEALGLGVSQREQWLAGLPESCRPLAPRLRAMLETRQAPGQERFLAEGPRLDALADAHRATAGDLVGVYRLQRELARGGMGTVWLAERCDALLHQAVAIKMPLVDLPTAVEAARFARERDVLASLDHPGIARLLDAGVTGGGQPFIVIEYVLGDALPTACEHGRLGLRQRLELFLQVLAAVDHAHKHLVVHRDLKPSNILVDASGRVRLLDFGIAKLLEGHAAQAGRAALTQVAGCAMTPRYAAPEQVENGAISTSTDIYALGVVLFELLTGASPYGAPSDSVARWVRAVVETPAVAPSSIALDDAALAVRGGATASQWRDGLAGDLDNIVLKALRKSPQDRYSSVERFAGDLHAFLAHRPVSARRPSMRHRGRLFVQRHRLASALGAVAVLATSGLAAVAWQAHSQTLEARARTDTVRDFMFDLVDDAEPDETRPGTEPTGREMLAGAVARARANFQQQPRLRGELLGELGRMRGRLGDGGESLRLLQEALALLETSAPATDPSLNKIRTYVASALLAAREIDRAEELARLALRDCIDGIDCAKARYYARVTLASVELRRGRSSSAVALMRAGVVDCEAGFGGDHPETALGLLGLAIFLRQAGELKEAAQALERADTIGRRVTLRQADRIQLARMRAVLALDLGRYALAGDLLDALVATVPDGADRAVLWRLRATVELALGRPTTARQMATRALSSAPNPPSGTERLFGLQALARALALDGDPLAGRQAMERVLAGLHEAGYADQALEVMRARRFAAEIVLREGRVADALALLRPLADEQQRVRAGQEVEYAQTLELLGCAERDSGHAERALGAHRQAAEIFNAMLPPAHPYLQRNALYREASAAATEAGGAALRLEADARAYAERFPVDSVWRRAIARRGPMAGCAAGAGPACGLVL